MYIVIAYIQVDLVTFCINSEQRQPLFRYTEENGHTMKNLMTIRLE